MQMSISSFRLLLWLIFISILSAQSRSLLGLTSPYLSPAIFFPNYQKMLQSFKIFVYNPSQDFTYKTPAECLFYNSLLQSPFVTQNAEEAHLFFVPFPPHISARALARYIRILRIDHPYWNRTLGADHFFLSCSGIGYESDRNLVELKKNSVQISCFPTQNGNFIPHKDITLPPLSNVHALHAPANATANAKFLGFVGHSCLKTTTLLNDLVGDPEFLVESEPSDPLTYTERLADSKFCLLEYGNDISRMGDALRFGCVPVVITDRPVQELPFTDVLRWQEMAVIARSQIGVKELKHELNRAWRVRQQRMRGLGRIASQHFAWNGVPQPFDSFNTVDVATLEVGLGGKYGATNVVPIVCGITSLGYDHLEILGNTLGEIAVEKAGIFKNGVPAFPVPQPVEAMHALEEQASHIPLQVFQPFDARLLNGMRIGLHGEHQYLNAGLAIALMIYLAEEDRSCGRHFPRTICMKFSFFVATNSL